MCLRQRLSLSFFPQGLNGFEDYEISEQEPLFTEVKKGGSRFTHSAEDFFLMGKIGGAIKPLSGSQTPILKVLLDVQEGG